MAIMKKSVKIFSK